MLEIDETFTTIWLSRSSEVRVKVRRLPHSPFGTIIKIVPKGDWGHLLTLTLISDDRYCSYFRLTPLQTRGTCSWWALLDGQTDRQTDWTQSAVSHRSTCSGWLHGQCRLWRWWCCRKAGTFVTVRCRRTPAADDRWRGCSLRGQLATTGAGPRQLPTGRRHLTNVIHRHNTRSHP